MTSWIGITNRENWEIIKKINIWGVSKKYENKILKVKVGDNIIFYTKVEPNYTQPARLMGIFRVISEVYEDRSPLFNPLKYSNEIFPLRMKLAPMKIFKVPLTFSSLVWKLNFIRNKENWGLHLRGIAMREISDIDFKIILDQIKD